MGFAKIYASILIPVAAFVAGIIMSHYTPPSWDLLPVALVCVAVAMIIWKRRFAALCLLASALGWGTESMSTSSPSHAVSTSTSVDISYAIVVKVTTGNTGDRLVISTKEPIDAICSLRLMENENAPEVGDIISLKAKLFPVNRENRLSSGNKSLYYNRNDIHYTGYVEGGSLVIIDKDNSFPSRMSRLRLRLENKLMDTHLDETTFSFLAATLLGDSDFLSDDTRSQYSTAGLSHMLALSGMHVAILVSLLGFLLLPVTLSDNRRVTLVVIIAMVWGYVFLTGMSPSIIRAAIMITALFLARLFYVKYSSFAILVIAALIILMLSPQELFAPGFQLSFLAMLSLVVIPRVLDVPRNDNFFKRWCISYTVFTLAAVLGTLLLSAYYFHVIPLLFLITNLPCALLSPLLLGGGVIVLIAGTMGLDILWLDATLNFICHILDNVISYTSQLSFAAIRDLFIPGWGVIVGYIAIAIAVASFYYKSRKLAYVALAGLAITVLSIVTTRDTESKYLIISNPEATNVVQLDPYGSSWIYTTASGSRALIERDRVSTVLSHDMSHKGIDSLQLYTQNPVNAANVITVCGRNILVVGNVPGDVIVDEPIHRILVTRHFSGDINRVCRSVKCDTVILVNGMNTKRADKYKKALTDSGRHAIPLTREIEPLEL